MDPYLLLTRPLPSGTRASPLVDLRTRDSALLRSSMTPIGGPGHPDAWEWCCEYVRRFLGGADHGNAHLVVDDNIKRSDRDHGADQHQLASVIDALDNGRPVAFYGWWPTAESAAVTDILGVDAMVVPTPDQKGRGLVEGHAVVAVGYGRHDAFPGGGYLIVANPWSARGSTGETWGDAGCGYLPFTFVRAYAITLLGARLHRTASPAVTDSPLDGADDRTRDSGVDPPAAANGSVERPSGPWRHPLDVQIARRARCADPRASYTELFFSENAIDTARAKAICARCAVRELCLDRAIERQEPYGVWGGEFLIDGEIVSAKRGRGRPRKVPLPALVDEVTGMPVVA